MILLGIRMVLYFIFAGLSGNGVGTFIEDSSVYSIDVDSLAVVVAGAIGFVITFITSRFAKKK